MDNPIEHYRKQRQNDVKKELEENNFEVHIAASAEDAKELVLNTIIPAIGPTSISWGGSITFAASGLYHALKDRSDVTVLDTFDKKISAEEMLERRRQALLVDLFITRSKAVTESGQLVNLDM